MSDIPITPKAALALMAALLLLAVAVFYALLFIFATAIGWRRLARTYHALGPLPLERFRSDGAVIGDYGWTAPPLTIAVGDEALMLVPRAPFRPIFAAVAIPWREIVSSEMRAYRFFNVYRLTLAHGGAHHQPMTLGILPTSAVQAIEVRVRASSSGPVAELSTM